MPIRSALLSLASNENCDGEPYDTMQAAATYIAELEDKLTYIEKNYRKDRISGDLYWDYERYNYMRQLEKEREFFLEEAQEEWGQEAGTTITNLRIALAELRRKNKHLREEITTQQAAARQHRLQIDAYHFVYGVADTENGVHRLGQGKPEDITLEVVSTAVRNTEKLVHWWRARQEKKNAGHYGEIRESDYPKFGFVSAEVYARWKRMAGLERYNKLYRSWAEERQKVITLENENKALKVRLQQSRGISLDNE